MVQLDFFWLDSLKRVRFSVLLSNPLTKDEFQTSGSCFGARGRSLRNGALRANAEISSKQRLSPLAGRGGADFVSPFDSHLPF
jgi:hypothetical protein